MRDKALFSFTILTGIRIEAIITLKIKDINLEKELVIQNSKHVKTKNSKTIHTYFFNTEDVFKEFL